MRPTFILSKTSSSSMTQSQLQQLNFTSSRLYRILLRECRYFIQLSNENEDDKKESKKKMYFQRKTNRLKTEHNILLQQPLDPRDWGRARLMYLDDMDIAHTPKSTMILEFFEHFRQSLKGFTSIASKKKSSSSSTTLERDRSVRVSIYDIIETIQSSFRQKIPNMSMDQILYHHRRAIDASRILNIQFSMSKKTIETIDEMHGVRVTATSRCIGRASKSPIAAQKGEINNRFAYRIRVENTGIPFDEDDSESEDNGSWPVQLLGRHWSIEENGKDAAEPIIVEAPTTGAVGHLPVIYPGEIFEYMSGCEIGTETGFLSGCFYMAKVDNKTQSAMVGEVVEALEFDDEKKFEMPIGPFPLVAENDGQAID